MTNWTPYPSGLDFWKMKLEKSSSMNWIFSLFRSGFLLPLHSCVACKHKFLNWFLLVKNPVCWTTKIRGIRQNDKTTITSSLKNRRDCDGIAYAPHLSSYARVHELSCRLTTYSSCQDRTTDPWITSPTLPLYTTRDSLITGWLWCLS